MRLKRRKVISLISKVAFSFTVLTSLSTPFVSADYDGFNTAYFKKWVIFVKEQLQSNNNTSVILNFDRNEVLANTYLSDFSLSAIKRTSADDLLSNFAVNAVSTSRDVFTVNPINGLLSGARVNQDINVIFYKGHVFPTYFGFNHAIWEHSPSRAQEFKDFINTQPWYEWSGGSRGSYSLQDPEDGSGNTLNASAKLASLIEEDYSDTVTLWRGGFTSEVLLLKIISSLLKGVFPDDGIIQTVVGGVKTEDLFGDTNTKNKALIKLLENLKAAKRVDDLDPIKEGKKILKKLLTLHAAPLFFSDRRDPAEQTFGKGGLIGIEVSTKVIAKFVKRKDMYLGFESVPSASEAYIEFASFSQAFFEEVLTNVDSSGVTLTATSVFESDSDINYDPAESELWEMQEMPRRYNDSLRALSCKAVLTGS